MVKGRTLTNAILPQPTSSYNRKIGEMSKNTDVKLISMDTIPIEEVTWLLKPFIPYGKITIIQGDPGEGKTTLVLQIIAALTTGRPIWDGLPEMEPIHVIYQTAEDGLSDTIKPRLVAAGADCARVLVIDDSEKALTLDDDRLEQALEQTGARLVVLDPIQGYIGSGVDMHRANEIRPLMHRLAKLAEKYSCAVILIGHMNKNSGDKSSYRGLGSIDIMAAVRSLLFIGKVKKDPTTRVLIHEKSSLAPPGETMAFKLGDEEGFRWVGAYEISADDLLDGKEGKPTETKLQRGTKLIYELLADGNAVTIRELDEKAKAQGISQRTMREARSRMKEELDYQMNEKQENTIRLKK